VASRSCGRRSPGIASTSRPRASSPGAAPRLALEAERAAEGQELLRAVADGELDTTTAAGQLLVHLSNVR
jgi:hypothetical protein